MSKHYVWVGVRESDISNTDNLFLGSITLFGSNTNGNTAMERITHKRVDHNTELPEYTKFVQQKMEQWINEDPSVQFVHYAPLDFQSLPDTFQSRFHAQNAYSLLRFLDNKQTTKQWVSDVCAILPTHLLPGKLCNMEVLKRKDSKADAWVAQGLESCGGSNTFLIDGNSYVETPYDDELYFISVYQKNSISVNFHAVIYEDDFAIFPPSIQIIDTSSGTMHYRGADYSAYNELSLQQRKLAKNSVDNICYKLQSIGYRGVCGIDLLITDKQCYFMEINPRFQASSFLLNHSLEEQGFLCLQQYHMQAFEQRGLTLPVPKVATGSFYTYTYSPQKYEYTRWLYEKLYQCNDEIYLFDDHLDWNYPFEEGAYLFKIVLDRPLSCVTLNNTLRIHPNLKPAACEAVNKYSFDQLLHLKLLLLCRGIDIPKETWCAIQEHGDADWEEFEAVNLLLYGTIWVSAPCGDFWSSLSPLQLRYCDSKFKLVFCNTELTEVTFQPHDPKADLLTKDGHHYSEIAYLNPDRLRIFFRSGCAMQQSGNGCRFCDLIGPKVPFKSNEIYEVLDVYLQAQGFRHILIGGGSNPIGNDATDVLALIHHIRRASQMDIYLMSLPITSADVLHALFEAGLTEIAFNIEVFDRSLAQRLMPGKGAIPLSVYQDALRKAVALWGRDGAVRSAVLLGFESKDSFAKGIQMLCEIGVSPILSVFRPAPGTPLANYMSLDENEVFQYYIIAQQICDEYGIALGPSCPTCQNNTVALTLPVKDEQL